jgi:RHS repeat-associated protein
MSSKNTSPDPPGKNIFLTSSFAGSYDGVGNLASYTDSVMGAWNFSYDSLNRLVSSHNTAVSSATPQFAGNYGCWSYDSFGNRLSQAMSTTPCNATPPLTSWASYNASNQFTATSAAPGGVPYDPAGDVTNDGLNQYLYDGEGRICAVASTPIPGMTAMTGYLYDADGTRVAKGTITAWSCDPAVNGFQTTSDYILGPGGEQVTEMAMDANNSMAWQHTNVYAGGSLIATYDNDGLHFYFNDPLGTRRAQTDYAGVLEQTCSSLPYGDGLSCSGGNLQAPTEHHFTGKERDTESGNDYFGARYYASTMGRWMSPDWSSLPVPIPYADLDFPQTLNLYAYLDNNPMDAVDATGHEKSSSNYREMGGGWTMRTDGARGADRVNVHFEKGGQTIKYKIEGGQLTPDETGKTVPKWLFKRAESQLESTGKFGLARQKGAFGSGEESSGTGATKEAGEGIAAKAFAALQIIGAVVDYFTAKQTIAQDGYYSLGGQNIVTDLSKFGDAFGPGTRVSAVGIDFTLQDNGTWKGQSGGIQYQLEQTKDGKFVVCAGACNA